MNLVWYVTVCVCMCRNGIVGILGFYVCLFSLWRIFSLLEVLGKYKGPNEGMHRIGVDVVRMGGFPGNWVG